MTGTPTPRITTIGLVDYAQFKVMPDSASIGNALIQSREDRVGGLGVGVSVFLPKPTLRVGLRVGPEFGAINRPQGPHVHADARLPGEVSRDTATSIGDAPCVYGCCPLSSRLR